MKFARFFIDRPIFAAVLSIMIFLVGAIAMWQLPISQYPEVVPPSVRGARAVSGREPEGDRRDGRRAARAGDQRRREHALHVLAGHQRRHDAADGHVPARHRRRQRAGAGAEPRRAGAAAPARGRAPPRRDDEEGLARPADGRAPDFARRPLRHACTCATTRRCRCATCWRACPAWARCACSAPATTRCASGSIPTGSRAAA